MSQFFCYLIHSGKDFLTVHTMMVYMHCLKSHGMCVMSMKDYSKHQRILNLRTSALALKRKWSLKILEIRVFHLLMATVVCQIRYHVHCLNTNLLYVFFEFYFLLLLSGGSRGRFINSAYPLPLLPLICRS